MGSNVDETSLEDQSEKYGQFVHEHGLDERHHVGGFQLRVGGEPESYR